METTTQNSRQKELEQIISSALLDTNLLEALQIYEMGQKEYFRAITGSISILISSGNSSNPIGKEDANLD